MSPPIRHDVRLPSGERIALDWIPPSDGSDAAVFIHGLGSHRRGEKAVYFAERFAAHGWGFLALDLRGHGDSEGSMLGLSLSRTIEDLQAALAWLPRSASVRLLIGSSMGGAVALWFNLLRPSSGRCVALIAPSLAFPLRYSALPAQELEAWRRTGKRRFVSEWIDFEMGFGIVEDGARYPLDRLIAGHASPTLILHGMRDTAVPWQDSVSFIERAGSPEMELLLIKDGDHRLTEHKAFLFDAMAAWLKRRGAMR